MYKSVCMVMICISICICIYLCVCACVCICTRICICICKWKMYVWKYVCTSGSSDIPSREHRFECVAPSVWLSAQHQLICNCIESKTVHKVRVPGGCDSRKSVRYIELHVFKGQSTCVLSMSCVQNTPVEEWTVNRLSNGRWCSTHSSTRADTNLPQDNETAIEPSARRLRGPRSKIQYTLLWTGTTTTWPHGHGHHWQSAVKPQWHTAFQIYTASSEQWSSISFLDWISTLEYAARHCSVRWTCQTFTSPLQRFCDDSSNSSKLEQHYYVGSTLNHITGDAKRMTVSDNLSSKNHARHWYPQVASIRPFKKHQLLLIPASSFHQSVQNTSTF